METVTLTQRLTMVVLLVIISSASSYGTSDEDSVMRIMGMQDVGNSECPSTYQQTPKTYLHTYISILVMSLAQLSLLLVQWIDKKIRRKKYQAWEEFARICRKQPAPMVIYLVLSIIDVISTLLQILCQYFLNTTIYQFFRSTIILSSFCFMVRLTGVPTKRHHYSGFLISFVGMIVLAVSGLLKIFISDKQLHIQNPFDTTQGMIALIGAFPMVVMSGYYHAKVQYVMKKYNAKPMNTVGMLGIYGTIITLVLITCLNFVPCHLDIELCQCRNQSLYMESISTFFSQLSPTLIWLNVAFFVTQAYAYYMVFYILDVLDCVAMSAMLSCRSILTYVVGLTITYSVDDPAYKFQDTQPWNIATNVFGLILLLFGMLLYTEIIHVKKLSQPKTPAVSQILNTIMTQTE